MKQERIARICWNSLEWKRPSGRIGKSKSKGSYEKISGWGHEEWLLDETKLVDGYHYAFLEQLNGKDCYEGKEYDIHLFTITPDNTWVYIGLIKDVVVLNDEEIKQVVLQYQKRGWLKEMKKDIINAGGDTTDFNPYLLFNMKFKLSNAKINYSNKPILKPHSIGHRYNLMYKREDFAFIRNSKGRINTLDTSKVVRNSKSGKIEIDPIHKKIQNAVFRILSPFYEDLSMEEEDEFGHRIDIKGKLKESGELDFFEVKTSSAKNSIREALGQILEYAHYPSENRADKLYIIGCIKPDGNDMAYLEFLRKQYKLPIWFRWYSFEEDKLYDAI